jgi:hypothetical protein
VRQLAATASGLPACTCRRPTSTTTPHQEKSKSLYLQFNTDWDTALPIHTAIGVRYEKTDVVSTALVPAAVDIKWVSQNEFPITFGDPTFTTLTGKYNNLLPSFDSDIELTPDQKLRFSYGETIGRPRYDQIQGGTTLNSLVRTDGGTGFAGQPVAETGQVEKPRPVLRVVLRQAELRVAGRVQEEPRELRRPVAHHRHPVQPAHPGGRRAVERGAGQGLRQHRHHLYP